MTDTDRERTIRILADNLIEDMGEELDLPEDDQRPWVEAWHQIDMEVWGFLNTMAKL